MPHRAHEPVMMAPRNKWIRGSLDSSGSRVRLFCFPYAGAGASAYLSWPSFFRPNGVDTYCIQLPGRETRFNEAPITVMNDLAAQICDAIEPHLDLPFSFFGHSMGTVISYEVARELSRRKRTLPQWLLISGAVAPHRRQIESLHALPIGEFLDAVARRYGGLPRELLANQELVDVVAPILQTDFALIERYRYEPGGPLATKIAAFGGRQDRSVEPAELRHWRDLTAQPERFQVMLFDSDHFFLHHQRQELLSAIAHLLA
jgi:medium-chain acyl-[acyl-carrier-protein] hydrolase